MLSNIKSFWSNLFSEKYNLKSELKLIIPPNEKFTITLNNINIEITDLGDVTVTGARVVEIDSDYLFLNCDDKRLVEMAKTNPEQLANTYESGKTELLAKYDYKPNKNNHNTVNKKNKYNKKYDI